MNVIIQLGFVLDTYFKRFDDTTYTISSSKSCCCL